MSAPHAEGRWVSTILAHHFGGVAQLVRATARHAVGRWIVPSLPHHFDVVVQMERIPGREPGDRVFESPRRRHFRLHGVAELHTALSRQRSGVSTPWGRHFQRKMLVRYESGHPKRSWIRDRVGGRNGNAARGDRPLRSDSPADTTPDRGRKEPGGGGGHSSGPIIQRLEFSSHKGVTPVQLGIGPPRLPGGTSVRIEEEVSTLSAACSNHVRRANFRGVSSEDRATVFYTVITSLVRSQYAPLSPRSSNRQEILLVRG